MLRALVVCLLLVGCGGGTPSPDAADEAASEDEAIDSAESDDSEGTADEAQGGEGSSGKSDDESPAAGAQDDVRTVLQLVLDDEELDPYLKLGQTGRFPLKIAGPSLPEGLVKATKPVVIVAEPSGNEPVLVFTDIDIKAKNATVRYRYSVENMQGSAVLKKGPYGWELVSSRVVERKGVEK